MLTAFDPEAVIDETRQDSIREHLARQLVAEVLAGPQMMLAVLVVDPLEEVWDPPDAALGQRDLQVGELAQHRRPDEIGEIGRASCRESVDLGGRRIIKKK